MKQFYRHQLSRNFDNRSKFDALKIINYCIVRVDQELMKGNVKASNKWFKRQLLGERDYNAHHDGVKELMKEDKLRGENSG